MNQFDMENEQVFQIVHDNPRRRGVIRDVGYIISTEQAKRFAAYEAAQKRRGGGGMSLSYSPFPFSYRLQSWFISLLDRRYQ